jgi:DNA-binding NtrC family response regulator
VLAEQAKAANVRVLVLTGHGLKLKPGMLDAYNYLLKPIRPTELTGAISRCLAQQEGDGRIVPFPKKPEAR